MTPLRVLVVVVWMVIVAAGSHMWTNHAINEGIAVVTHSHVDSTSVLDDLSTGAGKVEAAGDDDWVESRVDLNGNEVDDAIGDYRVDLRGEMYESHAPDTALPHLGAPRL
jgi:hypothetical protein